MAENIEEYMHEAISLRIKRLPEALGHQKLSRASKFSFRASKFFFFFMFKNL